MAATATWTGGVSFSVRTGSGHDVAVDGPPALGGRNSGARPMELLLASVATCSGVDVANILSKGKRPFRSLAVEVEATRAEETPTVFTEIRLRYVVEGAEARHVERAARLTVDKYCSALKMVEKTARISWEVAADGADA